LDDDSATRCAARLSGSRNVIFVTVQSWPARQIQSQH
jgi:hypothetical protein